MTDPRTIDHGFKLGKAAAQRDSRNIRFGSLLKAQPELPKAYDFDDAHTGVPVPMFSNDRYGNCVIAGRAHHTLRFELVEQGVVIRISDDDVNREYFAETGGPDAGLVVLPSLKRWRKAGWRVSDANYRILGFAELEAGNAHEVGTAIYANVGVGIGAMLPMDARIQLNAGQPWDVTGGADGVPGSWGGHYMYVSGYTPQGPVCVTWGRKQQATWAWLAKYCDEAYAIFDAANKFNTDVVDPAKLAAALAAV